MNRSLLTWLLAGALAASLSWNWTHLERAAAFPSCAVGGSCDLASAKGSCQLADQNPALAELCARSCGASDRLEKRADELQRELLATLSRPEVDADAVQRLADEVSELRRQSLRSCVDGILEVRRVLSPEQVAALLTRCERGAMEAR